jgi:hypothetical protein
MKPPKPPTLSNQSLLIVRVHQIQQQAVAIRNIATVEGIVSGNSFKMSLQVLQVWKRIKGKWVLIARQSVKLT